MNKIAKKLLSLVLTMVMVTTMLSAMLVSQVSAAAASTVTIKVADSTGKSLTLATWTYSSANKTYIDDATGKELSIVTNYSSNPLVYTGRNKKPDPRCLSVTTKGIKLEDLYNYATDLIQENYNDKFADNGLRGDTKMKISDATNFNDEFTYNQYWGLTRYTYMNWYNQDSYNSSFDDFSDGTVVPATLAITGYHSAVNGGTKTTSAALAAQADDDRCLRISLGMQKDGNTSITKVAGTSTDNSKTSTDINEGNLSVSNINSITFTLTDTFANEGIHEHVYENGCCTICGKFDPSATSYTVKTAAQLQAIATAVNSGNDFAGKTVSLESDIDATSVEWAPIGSSEKTPFAGTFEGNNHTVKLNISQTKDYAGLFGVLTGTAQNIKIAGTIVNTQCKTGAIAGFNKGTITNCHNSANITALKHVGGITGANYGTITKCSNSGTITGTEHYKSAIGGIVGQDGDKSGTTTTLVSDCYNTGAVSNGNGRWYGGIAGFADKACTIKNCVNTGDIAIGYKWEWNPIIGSVDGGSNNPKVACNYSLDTTNAGDSSADTMPCTIATRVDAALMNTILTALQAGSGDEYNKYFSTSSSTCSHANVITHEQADAKCKTNGYTQKCYECADCGLYFLNSTCTQQVAADIVVIKGLAHSWGEPTYEWTKTETGYTCTATVSCLREGCNKTSTETGVVTTKTVKPTYTTEGSTVYTASFENKLFESQSKTVAIDKLKIVNTAKAKSAKTSDQAPIVLLLVIMTIGVAGTTIAVRKKH